MQEFDSDTSKIVMVASKPRSTGTLFLPIFILKADQLIPVLQPELRNIFKNNGLVWAHDHPYNKNEIILANITASDLFDEEDPTRSLYQISKSTSIDVFSPLVRLTSFNYFSDNHQLPFKHFSENSNIFITFNNADVIGSYKTKQIEDKWMAAKPANRDLLDVYDLSKIINSPYYFKYRDLEFFLPNEIPIIGKRLSLSAVDILKRLLKKTTVINTIKITNSSIKEIAGYLTTSKDIDDLLRQSFPQLVDFGNIKEAIQILFADIADYNSIIAEINEYISENPKIKERTEQAKSDAVANFVAQQKHTVELQLSETIRLVHQKQSELQTLEKKKKRLEQNILNIKRDGKDALSALRLDYERYVVQGEVWRNTIVSAIQSIEYNESSPDQPIENSTNSNDKLATFPSSETLEKTLIVKCNFAKMDSDLILNAMKTTFWKLASDLPCAYLFSFMQCLASFGLGKRIAWLNVSTEYISINDFLNATCYVYDSTACTVADFCCKKELSQWQILCVFGANRAPIECYLGPVVRAIQAKTPLPQNGSLLNFSSHLVISLCYDSDNYTAKQSSLMDSLFVTLRIPDCTIDIRPNEPLPIPAGDVNESNNCK